MRGKPILTEAELRGTMWDHPVMAWRRAVLRETIATFAQESPPHRYRRLAEANVEQWRKDDVKAPRLRVIEADWGEVALRVTREYGRTFAVLNMANAYFPGGAYVEGAPAQEENMFRRTDCHFAASRDYDEVTGLYRPEKTALISAVGGRVDLDVETPRVCLRGPELCGASREGYQWLDDCDVFPFYELRAAAYDYRDGRRFNPDDARRRIRAQVETLVEHGVEHAVLGASGCGAFMNPAEAVASIYREELDRHRRSFQCVVFAVYHSGYGPNNFPPFAAALDGAWS